MAETVQHVEEMLDASPVIDVHDTFAQFQQLLIDLKAKIDARFVTTRDPSTEALEAYGTYPDGPGGRVAAYSGPEVDWMVHSWLGNPAQSFVNLHLTCWLGPQVRVPHLGIALLCWPGGWFYTDYIARTELLVDGEYFDRYYAPTSDAWLAHRDDPEFVWFTSRAPFIRASLSPNAYAYSFERKARNIDVVSGVLHAQVDRWLGWIEEAEPVPDGERAALRQRDLAVRRNIAQRDPANVMGVRYFGQETTDRLVGALWGADRQLERP
ncbi:oxidoreductase [Dactylosporangium sucinum]|nr:oxidoreductase [Dactylosporangium sucinum]